MIVVRITKKSMNLVEVQREFGNLVKYRSVITISHRAGTASQVLVAQKCPRKKSQISNAVPTIQSGCKDLTLLQKKAMWFAKPVSVASAKAALSLLTSMSRIVETTLCITLSLSITVHQLTVLVSEITLKKLKNYETSFTKVVKLLQVSMNRVLMER